MTPSAEYGSAFARWKSFADSDWKDFVGHRFVEALRDGSLPEENFLKYLRQDYIFLVHFSRAWALAIVKSETLDEMKSAAGTVNALVNHEMHLHIETCAAAGISAEQLHATEEEIENLAYTRYVLDAGHSGDFLDLMAALAPCIFGYGEIGLRLESEKSSDRYGDWIKTYAGREYQDGCKEVGALVDGALSRRLGSDCVKTPRWAQLCNRFRIATRLEIGFWGMALRWP